MYQQQYHHHHRGPPRPTTAAVEVVDLGDILSFISLIFRVLPSTVLRSFIRSFDPESRRFDLVVVGFLPFISPIYPPASYPVLTSFFGAYLHTYLHTSVYVHAYMYRDLVLLGELKEH